MPRQAAPYGTAFPQVLKVMTGRGLLLGSYDAQGKPNVMTIGWGSLGSIWGEPVWIVLVRPSRYTWRCIEHTGCFSVNVPGDDLGMACATCGSRSGRDIDKFAECRLTHEKGQAVLAPIVAECPIVYECKVVHAADVDPTRLDGGIRSGAYRDGDYHRMYFGQILRTQIDAQAVDGLTDGLQ